MHNPLRRLLTGSLMLLVASASMPALASDRLDPEERMRLRGEVRRHASEDRMRAREAWRGGRDAGAVGVPPPGGVAGQPPAGGRRYHGGPAPGSTPGYGTAPGYGPPAHGYGGPPGGAMPGYGAPPADGSVGYRGPGYRGGAGAGYGAPAYGPSLAPSAGGQAGGSGYAGGPRLSPEERQALRRQLRDARRHGLDDPSGSR